MSLVIHASFHPDFLSHHTSIGYLTYEYKRTYDLQGNVNPSGNLVKVNILISAAQVILEIELYQVLSKSNNTL